MNYTPLIMLAAVAFGALLAHADAKTNRNLRVPAEFQRMHPCPSNGSSHGACPGWQRDHIRPLCAGGPDGPSNMQWLSVQEHAAKTKQDVRACAINRRYK